MCFLFQYSCTVCLLTSLMVLLSLDPFENSTCCCLNFLFPIVFEGWFSWGWISHVKLTRLSDVQTILLEQWKAWTINPGFSKETYFSFICLNLLLLNWILNCFVSIANGMLWKNGIWLSLFKWIYLQVSVLQYELDIPVLNFGQESFCILGQFVMLFWVGEYKHVHGGFQYILRGLSYSELLVPSSKDWQEKKWGIKWSCVMFNGAVLPLNKGHSLSSV